MEPAKDLDAALRELLAAAKNPDGSRRFSETDQVLISSMLRAMEAGAVGLLLVEHGNKRLEYLIANGDREQAIELMSLGIQRNAQIIRESRRR